jgi:outer membrane protein OmpA-like peptidoglycan-associated protein
MKNIKLLLAWAFISAIFVGCADKTKVTIMPEEGGKVGVIEFVDKEGKSHVVSKAWESLEVKAGGSAKTKQLDESSVMNKYGDTIAAMPPKPKSFLIFFGSESADIGEDSKKELNLAVEEIKNKKANLVVCAGHTDSFGAKEYNRNLSLQRASNVIKYLVAHGVDKNIIEAHHYGDANPLVKAQGGAAVDPKNRRVEIMVK